MMTPEELRLYNDKQKSEQSSTNLKEVNFGLNQYCGPAVLSALTGESTDRCAAVISAVSGRQVIKAVEIAHLKEALKRLKFDVTETNFAGQMLYGVLYRMHTFDGLYLVFVPHHVIAIEVKGTEIYICDNHTKTPMDIKQSARLSQKVERVLKVSRKEEPKPEPPTNQDLAFFLEAEKLIRMAARAIEEAEDYIADIKDNNLREKAARLMGEL